MTGKIHWRAVLIAVGAVALIAGGIASAESPGDEVMSCVHKRTGKVRIVDGPEDCRRREHSFVWNQVGPQGPAGPQGPDGPPGPESLQVVRRTASQVVNLTPGYPDGPSDVTAFCEPGEIAISGGLVGFGVGEIEAELVAFGPSFDNSAWFFSWANTTEAPITISPTVVALCVTGELAGGETATIQE